MHTIGDAHVYVNHIDALKEQVYYYIVHTAHLYSLKLLPFIGRWWRNNP